MEQVIVTLWWLFFWTAIGLCLGSFLNVVIFRLPAQPFAPFAPLVGLSRLSPPHCLVRQHPRPELRAATRPLSKLLRSNFAAYPVVEMATAIVVLMLLDAFMIEHIRAGLRETPFGLTDRLSWDWPILLAHVVLFGCLFAMSAIDLEHYWVDIRFTNLVALVGIAAHTLWTPKHSNAWPRPLDTTAVVCLLALLGLVIVWLMLVCQPWADRDDSRGDIQTPTPEEPDTASAPPSLRASSRTGAWIAAFLLSALLVLLFVDETRSVALKHAGRGFILLAFFFILVVSESLVLRPADHAIIEAIDGERHTARSMVLSELGFLLPAIVLGLAGFFTMRDADIAARVAQALHTPISISNAPLLNHWTPLYGFATAATGFIIGGALGWAVRILFTLAFGKEAFGAGDIHMMAAAGCVAGWPVVVLGFFLTCVLALLGWAVTLPFKRTRAVPLGPWLSLSFLAVVIFYDPILRFPMIARTVDMLRWIFLDNSQPAPRHLFP